MGEILAENEPYLLDIAIISRDAKGEAVDLNPIWNGQELFRTEDRNEEARFACENLIAGDPKMLKAIGLAKRVAPTNATVLISDESGTGKEIIARCIHRNSLRDQRVFAAVNCAALAPTLIESEIFGHERGASPKAGQEVTVKGYKQTDNVIAIQVTLTQEKKTLKLRDDNGWPLWRGGPWCAGRGRMLGTQLEIRSRPALR